MLTIGNKSMNKYQASSKHDRDKLKKPVNPQQFMPIYLLTVHTYLQNTST